MRLIFNNFEFKGSSPFTRTIFNFPPSPVSSQSFLKFLINAGFSSFLVLFSPPSISRKIRPQPKYLLVILLARWKVLTSNSFLFYWPTFCGSDSHSSDGVLLWHGNLIPLKENSPTSIANQQNLLGKKMGVLGQSSSLMVMV